jgi:hypothetical protein
VGHGGHQDIAADQALTMTIVAAQPGWFRAIRMHGVTWHYDPIVAWQIIAPPDEAYPDGKFAPHAARAIVGDGVEYCPGVVAMALKRPDGKFVVSGVGGDVVLENEQDLNEHLHWRDIQVPETS